jgi:hypothetical protein
MLTLLRSSDGFFLLLMWVKWGKKGEAGRSGDDEMRLAKVIM